MTRVTVKVNGCTPVTRHVILSRRTWRRPSRVPRCCRAKLDRKGDRTEQQRRDSTEPSTSQQTWEDAASATLLLPRQTFRKVVRSLSSLPLAIGEISFIALLSASGTILEQGEPASYYLDHFSILGPVVLVLGLDHIYASPLFLATCALLTLSLASCSYSRQWPMAKAAKRWRFLTKTTSFRKPANVSISSTIPIQGDPAAGGNFTSLRALLEEKGYAVALSGQLGSEPSTTAGESSALYASKGLWGRYAPLGVHASIVTIIAGSLASFLLGWHGSVDLEEDAPALELAPFLQPNSPLAAAKAPGAVRRGNRLRLNRFEIEYYPDGKVSQFYSDLSIMRGDGEGSSRRGDGAVKRKTISVNDPLRFGGVTAYQTDWGVVGAKITVTPKSQAGSPDVASPASPSSSQFSVTIPMASLEGRLPSVQGRIWGGALPIINSLVTLPDGGTDDSNGAVTSAEPQSTSIVTVVARDLQNVALYDSSGSFLGIRRPGSSRPIVVGSNEVKVDALMSSSGLELKSDPGVPLVYTGFFFLMVTTAASYQSHSQIWALIPRSSTARSIDSSGGDGIGGDGRRRSITIGGRTNRAKKEFENEFNQLVKDLRNTV